MAATSHLVESQLDPQGCDNLGFQEDKEKDIPNSSGGVMLHDQEEKNSSTDEGGSPDRYPARVPYISYVNVLGLNNKSLSSYRSLPHLAHEPSSVPLLAKENGNPVSRTQSFNSTVNIVRPERQWPTDSGSAAVAHVWGENVAEEDKTQVLETTRRELVPGTACQTEEIAGNGIEDDDDVLLSDTESGMPSSSQGPRGPTVSAAVLSFTVNSCSASECGSERVNGGQSAGPSTTCVRVVSTEQQQQQQAQSEPVPQPRTISCEVQTDPTESIGRIRNARNNRRRDRRERRHRRGNNNSNRNSAHETDITRLNNSVNANEHLPDILNSHMPPPYSTLPHTSERVISYPAGGAPPLPALPVVSAAAIPPPPGSPHRFFRYPFFTPGSRRSRSSGFDTEEPKSCCGLVVTQAVSIRWFIVMIAFVGLCCAVVGTVLGALRSAGREHLTVSLLMIGVGIVLITVSGIAWRLTSQDAPSCRAMLGFGGGLMGNGQGGADPTEVQNPRRFVARPPPAYGRGHHPYAAMLYPEFQYRPPPPSYQASMQEYRLRLLLLDRQNTTIPPPLPANALSPPPTYRSNNATLRAAYNTLSRESETSRPPSYRSRTSSMNPRGGSTNENNPQGGGVHSRDPSLSLSYLSHESLFGNSQHSPPIEQSVSGISPCDNGNLTLVAERALIGSQDVITGSPSLALVSPGTTVEVIPSSGSTSSVKTPTTDADKDVEEDKELKIRSKDNTNLVTIVQTTDSSQVIGQDSVIVTVSGGSGMFGESHPDGHHQGEVQILAHL